MNFPDLPEEGIDLAKAKADLENAIVDIAMKMANGNKSKAAQYLGMSRSTLVQKLRRRGLIQKDERKKWTR